MTTHSADCPPEEHVRSAEGTTEEEQARDEKGLLACNDCGQPILYCYIDEDYHHVDPTVESCFLITR